MILADTFFCTLAQATQVAASASASAAPMPAASPAVTPWWQVLLNNSFSLAILFIFLVAIVGAVVKMRQRDKCLKLMRDHHVTYLATTGRIVWGDLCVYSQGLELSFDAPYQTREGIIKTSEFIYETKLSECMALCRPESALTDAEKRARHRQVRRSFAPGVFRRTRRRIVNFVNMIRDAVSRAFSAVLGQLAAMRPGSAVLAQQRTGIDQIGQTLLGTVARAYEPILEQHIGRPVVLTMVNPADEHKRRIELPGYLVDYSDKYVAVFNVNHHALERTELVVTESVEHPHVKVTLGDAIATLGNIGADVLVVRTVACGGPARDLHVALLPGSTLKVPRESDGPMTIRLERTRQLDIVCPRTVGTVLFGGDPTIGRADWTGLAPQQTDEAG